MFDIWNELVFTLYMVKKHKIQYDPEGTGGFEPLVVAAHWQLDFEDAKPFVKSLEIERADEVFAFAFEVGGSTLFNSEVAKAEEFCIDYLFDSPETPPRRFFPYSSGRMC